MIFLFKRVHGFVFGQVQGVFFRAHVNQWASELGLTGWVRNLSNGSVEFKAEGEEKQLKELIKKIRVGSPLSKVDSVELNWSDFKNEFKEFKINY